jgi:hypothetical protein
MFRRFGTTYCLLQVTHDSEGWGSTLTRNFVKFNHYNLQKRKCRPSCTDDICTSFRALRFHKNTNRSVLWRKLLAVCFNTHTEHISVNKGLTKCRVVVMLNMVVQMLNTTLCKVRLPAEFWLCYTPFTGIGGMDTASRPSIHVSSCLLPAGRNMRSITVTPTIVVEGLNRVWGMYMFLSSSWNFLCWYDRADHRSSQQSVLPNVLTD